ncbi:hypothetical protein [Kribbella sp. NPDC000426]|uniref:hypothetical protein n=1 Tax=Kribbella sp. NPDC000426 TaxID=3154255 RepID=UPI00331BD7B3
MPTVRWRRALGEREAGDAEAEWPGAGLRGAVEGGVVAGQRGVARRDHIASWFEGADGQVGGVELSGLPVVWTGKGGCLRGQGVQRVGQRAVPRRPQYDAEGPATAVPGQLVPLMGALRNLWSGVGEELVELVDESSPLSRFG